MKTAIGFFDVDTQHDFMSPDGALYVPGAADLVANLSRLLAAARKHGLPVVASMDAHVPDDPEFAIFPPHCVQGTAGAAKIAATRPMRPLTIEVDTPPELKAIPTLGIAGRDIVIEKRTYDVFTNPHAELVLAKLALRSYIVFGVATDYCVRAAVLGLRARGYEVAVVTDAIAAVNVKEGDGARALQEMMAAGASFATTWEILAMLKEEAAHVA